MEIPEVRQYFSVAGVLPKLRGGHVAFFLKIRVSFYRSFLMKPLLIEAFFYFQDVLQSIISASRRRRANPSLFLESSFRGRFKLRTRGVISGKDFNGDCSYSRHLDHARSELLLLPPPPLNRDCRSKRPITFPSF